MNLKAAAHYLARKHHVDAEDLLQEEHLAHLRGRTHGDGAMRDYIDWLTRRRNHEARYEPEIDPTASPENQWIAAIDTADLLRILSPRERDSLVLMRFYGLTAKECGKLLRISNFSVEYYAKMAMRKLRNSVLR